MWLVTLDIVLAITLAFIVTMTATYFAAHAKDAYRALARFVLFFAGVIFLGTVYLIFTVLQVYGQQAIPCTYEETILDAAEELDAEVKRVGGVIIAETPEGVVTVWVRDDPSGLWCFQEGETA